MRIFGLHPDQVLARGPAAQMRPPTAAWSSIVCGALGFGIVSVLAYSIWAYKLLANEAATYSATAAIYLGLTGVVLSRLVAGPGATPRFAALFATAFLVYAVAWCAFWFGLRGRHQADLWGAIVGLAAMTWLMQRAFGQSEGFLPIFLVLLAFHSAGYYGGEALYAKMRGSTGRLLWGAAHGLGFGAGVGYLLHRCQEPLKLRLRSAQPG
jgi:hypothetical protein